MDTALAPAPAAEGVTNSLDSARTAILQYAQLAVGESPVQEDQPEDVPTSTTETIDSAPAPEADPIETIPDSTRAKINERFGELTAARKAAEEKAAELEARLKDLESKLDKPIPTTHPDQPDPLASVATVQQLREVQTSAQAAADKTERLLDLVDDEPEEVEKSMRAEGLKVLDEEGREDFSPRRMKRQLRAIRQNVTQILRRVPEREQYLAHVNQYSAKATELLPELADPKSARAQRFAQVLASHPEIRKRQEWPLAAAVHVLGLETLDKMIGAAKPAAASPPPKPPRLPGTPRVTPAPANRTAPAGADLASALAGNNRDARIDYIKSLLPADL